MSSSSSTSSSSASSSTSDTALSAGTGRWNAAQAAHVKLVLEAYGALPRDFTAAMNMVYEGGKSTSTTQSASSTCDSTPLTTPSPSTSTSKTQEELEQLFGGTVVERK